MLNYSFVWGIIVRCEECFSLVNEREGYCINRDEKGEPIGLFLCSYGKN
jgi:hypothetical protein